MMAMVKAMVVGLLVPPWKLWEAIVFVAFSAYVVWEMASEIVALHRG